MRLCRWRGGWRVIVIMMIVMMVIVVMLVLTRIVALVMDDVLVLGDTFEVGLELALALAFWERAELHVDVASSHAWILIHMPHGQQIFFDFFGKFMPQLLMGHLTATEL